MQLRAESFLKPSLNWLLIFIPVALTLDRIAPDKPVLIFLFAALAIVPVASHIVKSTSSSRFCFTFFPEIKV
jgi:hypothetical protein